MSDAARGQAPITPDDQGLPSDQELLSLVRSLPYGHPRRDKACTELVVRHASIVRSCVRRYRGYPEPEELMHVGYVGLLKAINKFDPEVGGNLAAYAQPCVSGEIKRHFRDKRWQVRVHRHVQELRLAIRAADAELTQQLGSPSSWAGSRARANSRIIWAFRKLSSTPHRPPARTSWSLRWTLPRPSRTTPRLWATW
jgi:RNA polymerase sigma factor (sigma-70 family)